VTVAQDNLDELRQEYVDMPNRPILSRWAFDQDWPAFPNIDDDNGLLTRTGSEKYRFQWRILSSLNQHAIDVFWNYVQICGNDIHFTSGYRSPKGDYDVAGGNWWLRTSNHQLGRAFDFQQLSFDENYYVYYVAVEWSGAGADTYLLGLDGTRYRWDLNPPQYGGNYTQGHAAWNWDY
jgi:hypothetical protein